MSRHRSPLGLGAVSRGSLWFLGLLSGMRWALASRASESLLRRFAGSVLSVMWSDGLAFAATLLGAMLAIAAVGRLLLVPLVHPPSKLLLGLATPPDLNRLSSLLQGAFGCAGGVFVFRTSANVAESAWLVVGKAVHGSRT